MFIKNDLLKGRNTQYPDQYTQEISDNLDKLLIIINKVLVAYGHSMIISSGWRPPAINRVTPGAATDSAHCLGLAVDIFDPDGKIVAWVLQNLALMKSLGIYLEDFRWTPDWVHFGIRKPASGHRIYIPSANRALAPNRWDGQYDHSFD